MTMEAAAAAAEREAGIATLDGGTRGDGGIRGDVGGEEEDPWGAWGRDRAMADVGAAAEEAGGAPRPMTGRMA